MIEQEEACNLLKCGIHTLQSMLCDGTLPGLKVGKEWVIPREAFVSAINSLAVLEQKQRARSVTSIVPTTVTSPTAKKRGRPPGNPLLVRSSQPGWKGLSSESGRSEDAGDGA